jgi:hypothetical protein
MGKSYKEVLGNATWKFLHTLAYGWKNNNNENKNKKMGKFLYLLSDIYPCGMCGKYFKKMLDYYGIDASTNRSFRKYMCKMHNYVNIKLGKETMNCNNIM